MFQSTLDVATDAWGIKVERVEMWVSCWRTGLSDSSLCHRVRHWLWTCMAGHARTPIYYFRLWRLSHHLTLERSWPATMTVINHQCHRPAITLQSFWLFFSKSPPPSSFPTSFVALQVFPHFTHNKLEITRYAQTGTAHLLSIYIWAGLSGGKG